MEKLNFETFKKCQVENQENILGGAKRVPTGGGCYNVMNTLGGVEYGVEYGSDVIKANGQLKYKDTIKVDECKC